MINIFSWIATVLSLIGNRFVNRKNVIGMWIWTFANCVWMVLSIIKKDYAQLLLWCAYMFFSIEGIVRWSKEDKNHDYYNIS